MRPYAGRPDPDLLVRVALAPPRAPVWRRGWVAVPALAAAAAVVLGVFLRPSAVRHDTPATVTKVAVTQIGDVRAITLPDGSKMHLNTDTLVEANYTTEERRIVMTRGEAHFTVASNAQRPFVVSARHLAVSAVGTAFNVWLDAEKVEVLVTEGSVVITAPGTHPAPAGSAGSWPEVKLAAGERAVIPTRNDQPTAAEPVIEPVSAGEAERALAWREQRLEFVSASLAEVIAQFNRHNRHKLRIDPEAADLGDLRFGGGFRSDAQEAFVRLLEANFGIKAERRTEETILHWAK